MQISLIISLIFCCPIFIFVVSYLFPISHPSVLVVLFPSCSHRCFFYRRVLSHLCILFIPRFQSDEFATLD